MSWAQAGEGHRPCRPPRGASLHGTSAARRAIESVVAAVFEVDARELQARSRGSARTAFARQVAMYLAHVACGISLTDVGALFGRDRTTVSHACSLVEDKRDDPDLDCRLEHLEQAISCLINALSLRRASR
jgi:chromosomal replication initiation ATPase DnaA